MKISVRIFNVYVALSIMSCSTDSGGNAENPEWQIGIGGSYSIYRISGDYLYTGYDKRIAVLDLSDPRSPVEVNSVRTKNKIENLFISEDRLFIGSENGMEIYAISDPSRPVFRSEFVHIIRGCDPVLVRGDTAYITINTRLSCRRPEQSILELIDIGDIDSPQTIRIIHKHSPRGLAISEDMLYVCDAFSGLAVYDIQKPRRIARIHIYKTMKCNDILISGNIVVVTDVIGIKMYMMDGGLLVLTDHIDESNPVTDCLRRFLGYPLSEDTEPNMAEAKALMKSVSDPERLVVTEKAVYGHCGGTEFTVKPDWPNPDGDRHIANRKCYELTYTTGRDPTGRDPTGRDPTGRDPTGRDPTGRDPTGRDPTGRIEIRSVPICKEP